MAQKNIIIGLDGTWNQPEQLGGSPSGEFPTNVYHIWRALGGSELEELASLEACENKNGNSLIYVRGVGSQGNEITKIVSGATGVGIGCRIRAAYSCVQRVYENGDNIFIFGFSRGAFAARSLAGLLGKYGVSKKRNANTVYRAYINNFLPDSAGIDVNFLGVWDTVAAVALPDALLARHDVNPSNCLVIRHALALDEIRSQFLPVYFDGLAQDSNIKQVWFAGAHSNVGGGYPDANLSNIALFWILKEAKIYGLSIDLPQVYGFNYEKFSGHQNSYLKFWRSAKSIGKIITSFSAFKIPRSVLKDHLIHESVMESYNQGYRPLAKLPDLDEPCRQEPWGLSENGEIIDDTTPIPLKSRRRL